MEPLYDDDKPVVTCSIGDTAPKSAPADSLPDAPGAPRIGGYILTPFELDDG